MPEQIPEISIVIVNWNTADLLKNCIQSIIENTQQGTYEIIVIDNGSRDGSVGMVKQLFPAVILLQNKENIGFVKANNQGFAQCKGRYVLLLNSDTVILDRAIEKIINYFKTDAQIGVVGCKLLYPDGSFQNSCFHFPGIIGAIFNASGLSHLFTSLNWDRYGSADRFWSMPMQVDCVMGSFLMIERDILHEIGYFDETFFMYAEETDLCCRVKKRGKKVVYYPGASIIHYYRGSQKTWDDHVWSYHSITRGILRFLMKWKPVQAYFVNIIIVLSLLPRILFWSIRDIISSISQKSLSWKYVKKAGLFPWHCMGIFMPCVMNKPWNRKI
jgi:GT2 family glycosyltransferase